MTILTAIATISLFSPIVANAAQFNEVCLTEESKKCKIPFRILQCSTNREKPVLEENCIKGREEILGYDIAYSGGSCYSCVLNDIVSGRIEEFSMIQLNDNGLFETYEEAEAFFKYRAELEKNDKDYLYEKGDYVIYKIAEIIYKERK